MEDCTRLWRQYEVYHANMRDAQIYTKELKNPDYADDTAGTWRDYQGDPLIDIVMASDEKAAVKMVSEVEEIHENNLYAVEHLLNIRTIDADKDGSSRCAMLEISAYSSEQEAGLEIRTPDGALLVVTFTQKGGRAELQKPQIKFCHISNDQLLDRIDVVLNRIRKRLKTESVYCSDLWGDLKETFPSFQYNCDMDEVQGTKIAKKNVMFYLELEKSEESSNSRILDIMGFEIDGD